MASKLEIKQDNRLDIPKWIAAVLIMVAGLTANYYYTQQPWPLRLLGGLFIGALICLFVFQTSQGKRLINFARESRIELRKVVWPTRQETVQTTLVIAAMVILLALILWGVDGFLLWAIGWLTGQRG
jgi:preprotein translocase subunit SecE